MAKTINTRIALKIDTLTNWNASTFVPLAGEVCIAKVDTVAGSTLQPVMFKVGDGDHTFANLDWASAKAADVYGWAKAAELPVDDTLAAEGKYVYGFDWENDKLVPKFRDFEAEINEANKDKLNAPTTKAVKAYVDGKISEVIAQGTVVAEGAGIEVEAKANTYTVSHATPETVADDVTAAARTYVTGLTFDDFGHVTGVTTGAEADQDLSNYKTKQTAVGEVGAANQTLKISQNENGEITATPVDIVITASQVPDLDTGVMSVTGKDAIATTGEENVEVSLKLDNSGNVELTQSDDGLKADIDLGDYATTDAVDTAIDDAVKGLLGENVNAAYDTFKELQDILDGKEGAEGLIDEVAANKEAIEKLNNGTVSAKKASSLDDAGIAQVEAIKVNNAFNADEAAKVTHTLTINGKGFNGSADESFDLVNSSDFEAFQNTTLPATYKALQTPVENPTANGNTLAFIDSISQNANGEITVTKKTVDLSEYTKTVDLPEDPKASGSATIATKDDNGVVTLKAGANLAENHVLSNSNDADITLHKIATTGSIYDVAEGSNSGISKVNGEDVAVEYLIFNCGSATTII